MKHTLLPLILAGVVASAQAQSKTFTVGSGSPAAQLAQVESVTDFEDFTGRTDRVSGTISFDPKTKKGSGKLTVDVGSIDTGIPARNDHMRGPGWLDAAKFPTITFETTDVRHVKGDDYRVTGKLTLHGVTRTVSGIANVQYLAESEKTRAARFKGDVLRLRAKLPIKLADYGVVVPPPAKGKVAETVTLSVSTFAQSG